MHSPLNLARQKPKDAPIDCLNSLGRGYQTTAGHTSSQANSEALAMQWAVLTRKTGRVEASKRFGSSSLLRGCHVLLRASAESQVH